MHPALKKEFQNLKLSVSDNAEDQLFFVRVYRKVNLIQYID